MHNPSSRWGGLSAEQLAEILTAYIKPEIIGEALEKLENAPWELSEPVKVPSDSAIMFEWSQTPNTGDMRVDLIAFARALLARYG